MFRRKILNPGKNFRILPIWFKVPRWHCAEWHSAECRVPPQHLGTLHQWCVKFLSTIFPFWGRKYRIGIFGRGAAKMGKKSRRETLRTAGAMFPRKILSPRQNFRILPIWSKVPRRHSAECRLPPRPFGTRTSGAWSFSPRFSRLGTEDIWRKGNRENVTLF